jgi:Type I restriction enzyme R protein N terminus (HSDR_N)
MIELHYPDTTPKTRSQAGTREVFDPVRRQWVHLTPEEWVRQQFLQLLTETHQYPASLIAVEQSISLGALQKRFDILVYDRLHQPWMMIECKAQAVALDEGVLEQLLRYNMSVPVRYLLITNGSFCMGWERDGKTAVSLQKMPAFTV